ncbi:MAG: STAS domain-containing protein [Ruminococcus sp.]|nr:STAS domain-containing protein [Ruminococcus sp.]
MTITKKKDGTKLTIVPEGRIDSTNSQEFENEAKSELDGVSELVLDFEKINYISSAGLRVLLSLQKIMNKQGSMTLKNVNDTVNDIFEVTGFSEVLNIQ